MIYAQFIHARSLCISHCQPLLYHLYLYTRPQPTHIILTGNPPLGGPVFIVLCKGHTCGYDPPPIHGLEVECAEFPEWTL